MKIPGLDQALKDLKDLPDATARIEDKLSSIENLLHALVEIELLNLNHVERRDKIRKKFNLPK